MPLSSTSRTSRFPLSLVLILIVLAAGAYGIYHFFMKPPEGPGQQGAAPVEVITVHPESFRVWNEFSGRITAVDSVEVRPQVGGVITEIRFKEGGHVNAGDILFVIDPRPYQAAYDQAMAALNAARSQANLANVELKRANSLVKQQFLSKSNYDQRESAARVANAAIAEAGANAKQAKLNLEYAHVKAPISGRVGRPEITLGNLVQAGNNASLLTTIVANDQMYAEFDVDEQTYIDYMRMKNDGGEMPVDLKLSGNNGEALTYHGTLQSFDNQLNTESGTIRARAIFDNPDGALVPGMYATVHLGSSSETKGILLTERAIGTDQNHRFVYVVDEASKLAYREVKLGQLVNGKRVVLSGLEDGDRVVATGLQKLRPQMPVEPKEASSAEEGVAPTGGKQDAAQSVNETAAPQEAAKPEMNPDMPASDAAPDEATKVKMNDSQNEPAQPGKEP